MKRFVHFLLLLGIWLLLTWSVHWQDVLVGVIIALIADLMLGDIYPVNAVKILNPVRFYWFVVFTAISSTVTPVEAATLGRMNCSSGSAA